MKVVSKIMISDDNVTFCGPGPIQILRLIAENNSIKEVAKKMNISYSKALKLIDKMEAGFGLELVRRNRGGSQGGTSEITEDGIRVLKSYDKLLSTCNKFLDEEFDKTFSWI